MVQAVKVKVSREDPSTASTTQRSDISSETVEHRSTSQSATATMANRRNQEQQSERLVNGLKMDNSRTAEFLAEGKSLRSDAALLARQRK